MQSTDTPITVTHSELNRLLDYVVHHPDCELVIFRFNNLYCTCGLSRALSPFAQAEYTSDLPRTERVLINNNIYGGRSIPAWLCRLVSPKFRPISHRNPHQPSPMSDG